MCVQVEPFMIRYEGCICINMHIIGMKSGNKKEQEGLGSGEAAGAVGSASDS